LGLKAEGVIMIHIFRVACCLFVFVVGSSCAGNDTQEAMNTKKTHNLDFMIHESLSHIIKGNSDPLITDISAFIQTKQKPFVLVRKGLIVESIQVHYKNEDEWVCTYWDLTGAKNTRRSFVDDDSYISLKKLNGNKLHRKNTYDAVTYYLYDFDRNISASIYGPLSEGDYRLLDYLGYDSSEAKPLKELVDDECFLLFSRLITDADRID
jgi:hypothetical protein